MSVALAEENEVLDLKELEREITQLSDKDCVSELLRLQLTEYDMLQSMFSNPGEFSVDDYSALVDIDDYLNGKTSETPSQLDYTIHLNIDNHRFDVCVNLPTEYPILEPDVFIRCKDLNRTQQRTLNNDLENYISGLERGDICIFSAVSWLQESALKYFSDKAQEFKKPLVVTDKKSFSRYWIYSHHIYSKVKRREILELAHEYELTGFCLPGRPGIICLEGYSSNCEEWWKKVKNMNWKKIMCKKVEEIKLESIQIENVRKFPDFRELSFRCDGGKRNDCHMDFGEFLKYLKNYECEYIFKVYFGFDGK